MERIRNCRSCNSANITEFLDLGQQPYANSLLGSPSDKEASYPLSLSWCSNCSLVQLNHTADPSELFSNYVWVTSTSSTAREHARKFYSGVMARVSKSAVNYVLEAASNDGTFLRPFLENGHNVLGVDPAKNIADVADASGVPTKCLFFGVEAANKITAESGKAGVVIARNVLPHVAELHDFVKGLSLCLADDGLLVIEFHYAGVIYDGLHYDSIYHEHLCYFTLKSFEGLLNQYGLFVEDVSESPISGGSLIAYLRKFKPNETAAVVAQRASESKSGVNQLKKWEDFALRTYAHKDLLRNMLSEITGEYGPVIGYGASARSSTLLNFCGIDSRMISAIADQNPMKQGLYTAGTHIPIVSPEKALSSNPKFVLILAWNFADEIAGILKEKYGFLNKCILPLPNSPRIIGIG